MSASVDALREKVAAARSSDPKERLALGQQLLVTLRHALRKKGEEEQKAALELIGKGARVDVEDAAKSTPLHLACQKGQRGIGSLEWYPN